MASRASASLSVGDHSLGSRPNEPVTINTREKTQGLWGSGALSASSTLRSISGIEY